MTREQKITLINYRLERAEESIAASQLMYENGMFIPAMNRIYYSMFYTVQALLILDEKTFSKHSQVKGFFNKEYIKTGILPVNYGRLYNTVFEYRQKFDYIDLEIPEKELIYDYIKKACEFIDYLKRYINNKTSDM